MLIIFIEFSGDSDCLVFVYFGWLRIIFIVYVGVNRSVLCAQGELFVLAACKVKCVIQHIQQ